MNAWTIGKRVTTGFVVMIAIIICIGLFANWKLRELQQQFHVVNTVVLPSYESLALAEATTNTSMGYIYKHISSDSAEDMQQIEAAMETDAKVIGEALAAYEKTSTMRRPAKPSTKSSKPGRSIATTGTTW